ncbi:class I SAM-dependent methyltransferase [Marinibaculum pumilum]|uniref:Ubiquinone/menaquinone biosynthesis C-methyltransferase UbiE n=1 Tax=Marinibaculum pumilum TaxID=1766165 RepID=A0ABV7L8B8_9PROT
MSDPKDIPGPGTRPATVPFGFRDVAAAEKPQLVREVFDSVAARYDLMNDLMSFGVHRLWKARMIDWLAPRPGWRIADLAGGTGDIAFTILDRFDAVADAARPGRAGPAPQIVVADANAQMMAVGRDRAIDRGYAGQLQWVCAMMEALPLPIAGMDAVTLAFGIRNATDIPGALREARRVLKPGGRFVCLEFSRVVLPVLDRLYARYSTHLLPAMGAVVTRDAESYRYLAESIARFPPQERLAAMMREAGFGQVRYRNMSGGIVALHSGWAI